MGHLIVLLYPDFDRRRILPWRSSLRLERNTTGHWHSCSDCDSNSSRLWSMDRWRSSVHWWYRRRSFADRSKADIRVGSAWMNVCLDSAEYHRPWCCNLSSVRTNVRGQTRSIVSEILPEILRTIIGLHSRHTTATRRISSWGNILTWLFVWREKLTERNVYIWIDR